VALYHYRAKIPAKQLEQIEALTHYDQELYKYGCELFEEQLARFRSKPHRTYSIASRLRMAKELPIQYSKKLLAATVSTSQRRWIRRFVQERIRR
jgi:hypothetical protein